MTMKLYISPNYSEIDEYITISKSGFFFSAEFIEKNKLTLNNYCQFFTSSENDYSCLLYTSPSPRDVEESRMPSSA